MSQSKKNDLHSIDLLLSTFLITFKDGIALNRLDHEYYELSGEHIQYQKYGFSNIHSFLYALPSVSLNNSWVKAVPSEKDMHIHELVAEQKSGRAPHSQKRRYTHGFTRQYNRNYGSNSYYQADRGTSGYNGYRNVHPSNPNNWGKSHSYSSNPVNGWDSKPPVKYRDREFPNNSHNWNSCDTNDISYIKGHSNSISSSHSPVKYSNSELKISESHTQNEKMEKILVPLSEGSINRMKFLLNRRKNGVSSDQLVQCYSELFPEYKTDLDWHEMNHSCLDDLLKTAPDGLFSRAYSLMGHVMYFPGVLASSSSSRAVTPLVDIVMSSPLSEQLATKDDDFTPLDLKKIVGNLKKMSVHVAEIYTPSKFYLNPAHDSALPHLMKQINTFLSEEMRLQLRPSDLSEDMPVFILHHDGDYYRAKILDLSHPREVEVFIVDYGTSTDVESKDIYRLPRSFLQLPIQAFEATLNNVKPINSEEWETDDAAAWLMDHTSSKCVATFTDGNSPCANVDLYTDDETLSLNERMVRENLAAFCTELKSPSLSSDESTLQRDLINHHKEQQEKSALEKLDATLNGGVSLTGTARRCEQPNVETPFEKLAASLKMVSLNSPTVPNKSSVSGAVEVFSRDELMQIRKGMEVPLIVSQMEYHAIALMDNCLQSLIKQREECLAVLTANPERDDVFNYIQNLYSTIKEMRRLRGFEKKT